VLKHIGNYEDFGLTLQSSGGVRYVLVEYRIQIRHEGIISKVKFIIPRGGRFQNKDDKHDHGDHVKEEFYIRDLVDHEARYGDLDDIEMTDA
jgi:hypothetical protein